MEYIEMTHAPYNSQGELSHQPQQIGIVTEMMRSMEGGRITTLDIQRIMDATLTFGMSFIFMTIIGVMVRDFLREALGPEKKERVKPVIDVVLPATVTPKARLKIWDAVDKEKLRQYCEQTYGVPVTAEASDFFARLMDRRIKDFKGYLPLHLINRRGLTADDMYRAASRYFG